MDRTISYAKYRTHAPHARTAHSPLRFLPNPGTIQAWTDNTPHRDRDRATPQNRQYPRRPQLRSGRSRSRCVYTEPRNQLSAEPKITVPTGAGARNGRAWARAGSTVGAAEEEAAAGRRQQHRLLPRLPPLEQPQPRLWQQRGSMGVLVRPRLAAAARNKPPGPRHPPPRLHGLPVQRHRLPPLYGPPGRRNTRRRRSAMPQAARRIRAEAP